MSNNQAEKPTYLGKATQTRCDCERVGCTPHEVGGCEKLAVAKLSMYGITFHLCLPCWKPELKDGDVAECGTVGPELLSVSKVIAVGRSKINFHSKVELVHRTDGYRIAGSAMLYKAEHYAVVIHMADGTQHGRQFEQMAPAVGMLERVAEQIQKEIK